MVRKRSELPEVGDLVVGTIAKTFEYGAYVRLEEYGGHEAYLPWSEVSSKWVRDVKEFVKEGQKVVAKVIRVDRRKKHVDISLKRVSDSEQRRKLLEWKRAQRAEKLLEVVAPKIGKTLDDAYREVGWKLEDVYGEIFAGLELTAYQGEDVLKKAGVPDEWIPPIMEELKKHIEVKKVKIQGLLMLTCTEPDGVARIKEVLQKPLELLSKELDRNTFIKVYTIGAPRYRVEVVTTDYKYAEKLLNQYTSTAQDTAKELNVNYSFERER
ncbi:MAG: translation initiation factor IF-2 subunit alpha [Sulfolobales archaeon]|nr:translation initiation factor IF-2 subunit alpha [Sulfolobales archaeon]